MSVKIIFPTVHTDKNRRREFVKMMALENIKRDVRAEEEVLMTFHAVLRVDGAHFSRDNETVVLSSKLHSDPWES